MRSCQLIQDSYYQATLGRTRAVKPLGNQNFFCGLLIPTLFHKLCFRELNEMYHHCAVCVAKIYIEESLLVREPSCLAYVESQRVSIR